MHDHLYIMLSWKTEKEMENVLELWQAIYIKLLKHLKKHKNYQFGS